MAEKSYTSAVSEAPLLGDTIGENLDRTVRAFGDKCNVKDVRGKPLNRNTLKAAGHALFRMAPARRTRRLWKGGPLASSPGAAASTSCKPGSSSPRSR